MSTQVQVGFLLSDLMTKYGLIGKQLGKVKWTDRQTNNAHIVRFCLSIGVERNIFCGDRSSL